MNISWLVSWACLRGGRHQIHVVAQAYSAANHRAEDFSATHVKAMGLTEVLGGAGLILPALFDISHVLVPVAASGLALYMAGAGTERIAPR